MHKKLYKVRFETDGHTEFTLNSLWRAGAAAEKIKRRGKKLSFSVPGDAAAKAEAALKRGGVKYSVKGVTGVLPAAKRFFGRYFLILGIAVSFAAAVLYSSFVGEVRVVGAGEATSNAIAAAVKEELKSPFVFGAGDFSDLELKIARMEDVALVSVNKTGRRIVVNVVEELPEIDITDTRTPLPFAAEEDGKILRIVVLRGTPAVKEGDSVSAGQVLISPFVADAEGNETPVRAMGIIDMAVTRTVTLDYTEEADFSANASADILANKREFENSLGEHEVLTGYSFDVKKLDKSTRISIYYNIITRVKDGREG